MSTRADTNSAAGRDERLEVEHLSAWYGQARALSDVALTVETGHAVGLVGRNGSGKTTLLRCIAGAHTRVEGRVAHGGSDLLGRRVDDIAALGVSLVRESGRVFQGLTVDECLTGARHLASRRGKEALSVGDILDWMPILGPLRKTPAGYLSGGQRQALALAMALTSRPTCLLLDEPSAGLHETLIESIFAIIAKIVREGVTMLIAEQRVNFLEDLVDRIYVLETGSISNVVAPGEATAVDVGWEL